jgi:hypothetical protein
LDGALVEGVLSGHWQTTSTTHCGVGDSADPPVDAVRLDAVRIQREKLFTTKPRGASVPNPCVRPETTVVAEGITAYENEAGDVVTYCAVCPTRLEAQEVACRAVLMACVAVARDPGLHKARVPQTANVVVYSANGTPMSVFTNDYLSFRTSTPKDPLMQQVLATLPDRLLQWKRAPPGKLEVRRVRDGLLIATFTL